MTSLGVIFSACWVMFFQSPMALFASLKFESIVPVALAVLAVGVGYTSLLYNRARAHPKDRIGRRSLKAADAAFSGTLLLLFTIICGIAIGSALLANGYQPKSTPPSILGINNLDFLPALAAVILLGPAQFAAMSFYTSVRLLVRRDFICGPSRRSDLKQRRVA